MCRIEGFESWCWYINQSGFDSSIMFIACNSLLPETFDWFFALLTVQLHDIAYHTWSFICLCFRRFYEVATLVLQAAWPE
jgi:hypothetical protein